MLKLLLRRWGIIPQPTPLKNPSNLPYYLLRIESGVILFSALFLYFFTFKASWILFLLLLVAPDLSLFGYAFSLRLGAIAYNFFHTYTSPALLLLAFFFWPWPLLRDLSLIWLIHIAQDRLRGRGLKYTDVFEGTHFQKL